MSERPRIKKLNGRRHQAWDLNRARRSGVAMQEVQFPGSLGFGIKPKDPTCDLLALIPNDQVEFMVVRYCPARSFPAPQGKYMEAHLASLGEAKLEFGMPKIQFPDARRTSNMRLRPDTKNGRHPLHPEGDVLHSSLFDREFGIFNRLSEGIDRLAFCGVNKQGDPLRPGWYYSKPMKEFSHADVMAEDPRSWMIDAYVGVSPNDMERLYNVATEKTTDKTVRYSCPKCHAHHAAADFTRPQFKTKFLEDNFVATCPKCHRRSKYFLDHSLPARTRRHFNLSFMIGFCEWLSEGAPLRAPHDMQYLGMDSEDPTYEDTSFGPKLRCHTFGIGEENGYALYLHESTWVKAQVGEEVKQGDILAYATEYLSVRDNLELRREWAEQPLKSRWATLPHMLGGKDVMGFMQKLWFDNQVRYVQGNNGRALFAVPTRLMGQAAGRIPTHGLWWDLSPAADYFDPEVGAIICPPIRIGRWDKFQINLPGQVRLDATVSDPRFNPSPFNGRKPKRHTLDAIKQERAGKKRKPRKRCRAGTEAKQNQVQVPA